MSAFLLNAPPPWETPFQAYESMGWLRGFLGRKFGEVDSVTRFLYFYDLVEALKKGVGRDEWAEAIE